MYLDRLKTINWKYIVGEIMLIFVGIQLSVLYSNWTEDKKEKRQEIFYLSEIEKNIQDDINDLDGLIYFMNLVSKSDSILLNSFKYEPEFDSSVMKALGYCFVYGQFFVNKAAYEALKSQGLELISHDSVRTSITYYYETLTLEAKINESSHSFIHDEGNKILAQYVRGHQDLVGGVPSDYKGMKNDVALNFYLSKMIGLNNLTIGKMERTKRYLVKLGKGIGDEISRLED